MKKIYACEEMALIGYLEVIHGANLEGLNIEAISEDNDLPVVFTESDNGEEATIAITGILSKSGPSMIDRFFGIEGTGYNSIIKAAEAIGQREKVTRVKILMDTPGGEVSGVDEAYQAIRALSQKKEVTAVNTGMIASAGYWLASAASKIEASSPVALTGSIGVVIVQVNPKGMYESAGIKIVEIVSKNAPGKRPDGTTKEGRSILQEEADAIERSFIGRVAEGRGITEESVIKNFGQGRVLVAFDPDNKKESALNAGMIDSVRKSESETISGKSGVKAQGGEVIPIMKKSAPDDKIDRSEKKIDKKDQKEKTEGEEEKMETLKELMEKNPLLAKELDDIKAESFEKGQSELQAKINQATKYLSSDDYSKPVKNKVIEALEGKLDFSAIQTAIAMMDMVDAEDKGKKAAKESGEIDPVAPENGDPDAQDDGVIRTAEKMDSEVSRFRQEYQGIS